MSKAEGEIIDLKMLIQLAGAEGIGIGRVTQNLAGTQIDEAIPVSDAEAVETAYRLLYAEGLLLGSASGVNVAAAARVARQLGRGHTIVTVLCDSAEKYLSEHFWDEE